MVVKKSNIFSINLSDKAVVCLQHINYLGGNKRSVKGSNLSDFISNVIVEYVGLNYPEGVRMVEEKLLLAKINGLDVKRRLLDDEIVGFALKLRGLKDVKGGIGG